MSSPAKSADWCPVFLIGDTIAQAVDGCTCSVGYGITDYAGHEPECGLEPIGHLATPAHDALVRDDHGETIAKAIEADGADLDDHPHLCMRLNCGDCLRRHLIGRYARLARTTTDTEHVIEVGEPA